MDRHKATDGDSDLLPSPCRGRVLTNIANLDGDFHQISLKMAVDPRLFPIAGPSKSMNRPNKRRIIRTCQWQV